MGRSKAKVTIQPDDFTCGPASLKVALEILGIRKSLPTLTTLCATNPRYGTSVNNLIKGINRLGLPVLAVEWANLRHLQSALKYTPQKPRAVIVDYLYDLKANAEPHEESGHYSTVASYSARDSRIILFDPSNHGRKKSFKWTEFLDRWYDFDFKRRKIKKRGTKFKLVKSWSNRLLLVISKDPSHLPKFTAKTSRLFLPANNA